MNLYKEINDNKFDFIYVDGSHLLLDSYVDILLSWKLLNNGGILVIDDVVFNSDSINKQMESPLFGVNYFLKTYAGQYKLLNFDYRLFLEKV